ncbi:MAG: AmmeMemoRadiSam system radical SAM enzyme [Candidatus Aenigmarchaeota archaeon]|nr:AmmeMemoRadiSam system radical SAM enzyme [Candidatus Aenigmarchaeota archaeon]
MHKAMFWTKKSGKIVQCHLCPRECVIGDGKRGFCGVRQNFDGVLYSLVYAKPVSIALDPIEKKPLFHFLPGTQTLSIATVGCNFTCKHCQNWEISQYPRLHGKITGEDKTPEEIVDMAVELGAPSISWTYTEPTVFYEFFYDTAKLAKKRGIKQVWVSNGFTSPEAIRKARGLLDAVNIDWKGNDKFYHDICSAWLEPIKKALLEYKKIGAWIEITNLIIPTLNDSEKDIEDMCIWIKKNLGKQTPIHFSAYYPCYKLDNPPTPPTTLEKAAQIAERHLDYVYIGNVFHNKNHTFCPNCKKMLIERVGNSMKSNELKNGKCPSCGKKIAGIFL